MAPNKILYVSDLDGTLLRSDETLSQYTCDTINNLVSQGMIFSYATARSYHTAKKVTDGFNVKIPVIVYNGTMIKDNETGEILAATYFEKNIKMLIQELIDNNVYPIVYAIINGQEKFSYHPQSSQEVLDFVATRSEDSRKREVKTLHELYQGDIFYISCIDHESKLDSFYQRYKNKYNCIYSKDVYTNDQWLEILPPKVSKSNAIQSLKKHLNCEKVIAFGDGLNDIDMFTYADECYAVADAVYELKEIATGIIRSNDEDAVASWLSDHYVK